MLQYKIPQNVGIEDKIVGPLSLKQLIMVAGGIGVSWMLFGILSKLYELNILEYIIIGLPAAISAALALIKINDVSLTKFILLTLEFSIKPKKRVWDHRGIVALVDPNLADKKPDVAKKEEEAPTEKKPANLRTLSQVLDSGGFDHVDAKEHDDIDAAEDDDLMAQAYFGHKDSDTENMYWRANKHDRGKRLALLSSLPTTQVKKEPVLAPVAVAVAPQPVPAVVQVTQQVTAPVEAPVEEPVEDTEPVADSEPVEAAESVEEPQVAEVATPVKPKKIEPTPAPQAKPTVPPPVTTTQAPPKPKKRRRRRRKKKKVPAITQATNVNTTNKNQPAQFVAQPPKKKPDNRRQQPKRADNRRQQPKKQNPPPVKRKDIRGLGTTGELKFEELKSGDIEINLD